MPRHGVISQMVKCKVFMAQLCHRLLQKDSQLRGQLVAHLIQSGLQADEQFFSSQL